MSVTTTATKASLTHTFVKVSTTIAHLAMGAPGLVWCITTDGKLQNQTPGQVWPGWQDMPALPDGNTPLTLDCGADGTAIVLDTKGNAWRYSDIAFKANGSSTPTMELLLPTPTLVHFTPGSCNQLLGVEAPAALNAISE